MSKVNSVEEIYQLREDLSPFLIHLTRAGGLRFHPEIWPKRQDSEYVVLDAKESLTSILDSKKIVSVSAFGYFNFKCKLQRGSRVLNADSQIERSWLRATCFTETPIDHVYIHLLENEKRKLRFMPYGLAFREDSVRKESGNPVFYFNSEVDQLRNTFDRMAEGENCRDFKDFFPLVEGFGPPLFGSRGEIIDFRWEREWRISGKDFPFELTDIHFGICPENEIEEFEDRVSNQFPFIDPTSPIGLVKKKLRERGIDIK